MTPAEQHHAMRIAQLEAATGQTWEREGTSRYICTEQVIAYCYFSESHGCTMRVADCVDLDGAEVHLHASASDPDISRAWVVARNACDAATKRLTSPPNPFAVLDDAVRTEGGVVRQSDLDADQDGYCIPVYGVGVVPRCLLYPGSEHTHGPIDALWRQAREVDAVRWTPIEFFRWLTDPNPALDGGVSPLHFMVRVGFANDARSAVEDLMFAQAPPDDPESL